MRFMLGLNALRVQFGSNFQLRLSGSFSLALLEMNKTISVLNIVYCFADFHCVEQTWNHLPLQQSKVLVPPGPGLLVTSRCHSCLHLSSLHPLHHFGDTLQLRVHGFC